MQEKHLHRVYYRHEAAIRQARLLLARLFRRDQIEPMETTYYDEHPRVGRPVRLKGSEDWGAVVKDVDVKEGDMVLVVTRYGQRRIGVVDRIVYINYASQERIVSFRNGKLELIPNPQEAQAQ